MPMLFDTSKCQVRFRKPRILQSRKLFFDHRRRLNFDHVRMIDARLQGVIFREKGAVGFRNIGVSNIDEITGEEDWPDVGQARPPETLKVERSKQWEKTWGKESTYLEMWGVPRSNDTDDQLYESERIKPQISYHKRKTGVPSGRTGSGVSRNAMTTPKVEVSREPVMAVSASSLEPRTPTISHEVYAASARDKKRALLFNEYALALMDSQKYERAMTYFKKAQDIDPGEETYRINMERCREWLEYQKRGGRR